MLVVVGIIVMGKPAQMLPASGTPTPCHRHGTALFLRPQRDSRAITWQLRGGEDESAVGGPPSKAAVRKASYMLSRSAATGDVAKVALSLQKGADAK